MNRTMFRILSSISLAALTTFGAHAAEPSANLTPQQAGALAATANTPAQHAQLAQYFRMKAEQYTAETKVHEQMIAAYKADATKVSTKNRTATLGHCENEVRDLQAKAAAAQKLAATHEQAAGMSPAVPVAAQAADDCCGGECNQAGHNCCKGSEMSNCCRGKCKQSGGDCCHGSAGDCCGGHMNMK